MKLHFITSITKNYWNATAKYCIPTWNLPGDITIYVDQKDGDLNWLNEVPHDKQLLNVKKLKVHDRVDDRTKVRRFWGKASAQIEGVRNRGEDTRIVWLDADIEQKKPVDNELFDFNFPGLLAIARSNTEYEDRFESGIVLFNHENDKLNLFINHYEKFWNNEDEIMSLYRPYDAHVIGHLVSKKNNFFNLCDKDCLNRDALKNSRYNPYFIHHINKTNKENLRVARESK